MDLDKLVVGRRYRFTAIKRGELFTVEGTFKGFTRFWWPSTPIEDDVETKVIVIRTDDDPISWSLDANRVTNIEPLD